MVPVLVDPAVPTTRNGRSPASRSAAIISRAAATSIRSPGTTRRRSAANPVICAAFATQWCVWAVT
jgi:hypothetical protein